MLHMLFIRSKKWWGRFFDGNQKISLVPACPNMTPGICKSEFKIPSRGIAFATTTTTSDVLSSSRYSCKVKEQVEIKAIPVNAPIKAMIIAPSASSFSHYRGELVSAMKQAGHQITAIAPDQDGEAALLPFGAGYIHVPYNRKSKNPIDDIKFMLKLKKIIKREQPDLVFSYALKPIIYGSIAAKIVGVKQIYSMLSGLGIVYVQKDSKKAKILKTLTNILLKIAFKCCTRVFFQNPDDREELVQYRLLKKEKGVVIDGSGINLDKFPRCDLPERVSFAMISRIMTEKGVREYCQAARIVKKKYPQVSMKLVGPFDEHEGHFCPEELSEYTSSGDIDYLGETNNVVPFLAGSTVFVLPTYYREGVPHSILEAMAMGRAIITTDMPGCREAVVDHYNGFLVPIKNSEAIAEKMIWMIEHPNDLRKMCERSHSLAADRFDVDKVNREMLSVMGL